MGGEERESAGESWLEREREGNERERERARVWEKE